LEFIDIQISKEESFANSSEKILLKTEKTYRIITKVQKYLGEPFCAYFGVILFNEKDEEIDRRIRWLEKISENKIHLSFVFKTPKNFQYVKFIYRINKEVPFKSAFKASILNPNLINYEFDDSLLEDYDVPENYQLPLNKVLTYDEENKLEEKLVWIFGAPRSGTSWLGTQLLSHETHSLNEPLIGMHLGHIYFRSETKSRSKDLFQNEIDYFFSNRYKETWKYHLRKLILNRIFAQFKDYNQPIIIKEPNGSLASDIISETLPKSKFIFLKRDGRDVIDSRVDSMKKDGWATNSYNLQNWPQDDNENKKALTELCLIWVNTINIILKAFQKHPDENKLEIQYEKLKKDTINELQKIYRFIEIKISPEELRKIVDKYNFKNIPADKKGIGKITRKASPGNWKESFSKEEQDLMMNIIGKQLKNLGYK